jgi:4-nitrophenyl phosphatase
MSSTSANGVPVNAARLSNIRCFLVDMDGTFYLGDHLLPGALDFITAVKSRGADFLFLTNNSSRRGEEYAEKIRHLGLDIPDEKVFTSGEATTIYLSGRSPSARIFLVGTPALEAEFEAAGFKLVQDDPDYAVLGFDTTITYAKLWRLCDLVRARAPYIATHHDLNCPTDTGYMPDIGAMIAFVQASTGRSPDVIVGKPHPPIVEALVRRTHTPADALGMVGDRLYTDIAMGSLGVHTVLVLSGETRAEDLEGSSYQPDLVVQNLAELASLMGDLPAPRG